MLFDRVIIATTLDMRHLRGKKKSGTVKLEKKTSGAAV